MTAVLFVVADGQHTITHEYRPSADIQQPLPMMDDGWPAAVDGWVAAAAEHWPAAAADGWQQPPTVGRPGGRRRTTSLWPLTDNARSQFTFLNSCLFTSCIPSLPNIQFALYLS